MSGSNRSSKTGDVEISEQPNASSESTAGDQSANDSGTKSRSDEQSAPQVNNPSAIKAESTQTYTETKDQREQQDLQAQQDMAFWAMWMFFATFATVIITAFGVWFVKRTLDATLKAVQETGKGTAAIHKSNTLSMYYNEIPKRPKFTLEFRDQELEILDDKAVFTTTVSVRNRADETGMITALNYCERPTDDIVPPPEIVATHSIELAPPIFKGNMAKIGLDVSLDDRIVNSTVGTEISIGIYVEITYSWGSFQAPSRYGENFDCIFLVDTGVTINAGDKLTSIVEPRQSTITDVYRPKIKEE